MCEYIKDLMCVVKYAQKNPDTLYDVVLRIHGTVQRKTDHLTNIFNQYNEKGFIKGDGFDWRMDYINHFGENRKYYYDNMMKILRSKKSKAIISDRILELFLEANGLGLAKASFAGLLCTGMDEFSCLDSNLLKWNNLNPNITDYNKKCKDKQKLKEKRQTYFGYVKETGGGHYNYILWCDKIGEGSKQFIDGKDVSRHHPIWFTREARQAITS
tara:strand:- start:231 stop:872 length:642 start_codon:yes stop_codon:yes gene_type:complete